MSDRHPSGTSKVPHKGLKRGTALHGSTEGTHESPKLGTEHATKPNPGGKYRGR